MDLDEYSQKPSTLVGLQARIIHGIRNEVRDNVHFTAKDEVIFPVESVFVLVDYVKLTQLYLRPRDTSIPLYMVMGPNCNILAILEKIADDYKISLYDIENRKKRRTIDLPHSLYSRTIVRMMFTCDGRHIAILTKAPNEWIYMISLEKNLKIMEGPPTLDKYRGRIICMSVSNEDGLLLLFGGNGIISYVNRSEDGILEIFHTITGDFIILSMTFLESDLILLGTNNDELILVENGDIKLQTQASSLEFIDVIWEFSIILPSKRQFTNLGKLYDKEVLFLTAIEKGFFFIIFNNVFVFEKITNTKYQRKTIITLNADLLEPEKYKIIHISLSYNQANIIAKCEHTQIYHAELFPSREAFRTIACTAFEPFGPMIHSDAVVDVSICSWKPIIMTASRDKTIRIYNYKKNKVELMCKFQTHINIVEMDASGILAAIGFIDQLRVCKIYVDSLIVMKTYNFPRCKCIKYSNYGHFMAAAYENNITVTSTFNLDILKHLKAHNGTVLSLAFTKTDQYLISSGAEGAIYQWDIEKGVRVLEIVQKGIEYISVAVTRTEPYGIYAATHLGSIRFFENGELRREVFSAKEKVCLTDLCFYRSGKMMFATNVAGKLFNVQLPFMDAGGGKFWPYNFFTSKINRIKYTYCGTKLLIVSDGGTFGIWDLTNIEGKLIDFDRDLLKSEEVLIPRKALAEKIEHIKSLELRLKQQAQEFEYQISQNEIFDGQQLAEVHREYCMILEELKQKNTEIEGSHTQQMNQITLNIKNIKEEYRKNLDAITADYSDRMLAEYHKYNNLHDNITEMRDSYEHKLQEAAGILQETAESLECNYKMQLKERTRLIRELMKETHDKKVEFFSYSQQVELETERMFENMRIEYQNMLSSELWKTLYWQGNSGVIYKQNHSLLKKLDTQLEQIKVLKEEISNALRRIRKLNHVSEELIKDISDRDYTINTKETRIQEYLHKNQELDKYKQVLSHSIAELKAMIEPIEFIIMDKSKTIMRLETELEKINKINLQLETQIEDAKEKYVQSLDDLKVATEKAMEEREKLHDITTEIYYIAGKISSHEEFADGAKEIVKKFVGHEQAQVINFEHLVNEEFKRQKQVVIEEIEKLQSRTITDVEQKQYNIVYEDNLALIKQINEMKAKIKILHAKAKYKNEKKLSAKTYVNRQESCARKG